MKIEIHKAISAIFLSLVYGLYLHHTLSKWNQLGRSAFLEYQAQRFDRHMAAVGSPLASMLGALIVVLGTIAIYELISLGLSRVLKSSPGNLR
jgi:hypothetical protein